MGKVFVIETIEQFRSIMIPIRAKIMEAMRDHELTTKQIAEKIHEVPSKAYYHIKGLEKVGILVVTKTVQKGNLSEKYYKMTADSVMIGAKLNQALCNISSKEALDISNEHLLNFVTYIHDKAIRYVQINNQTLEETDDKQTNRLPDITSSIAIECTTSDIQNIKQEINALAEKYKKKTKETVPYRMFNLIIPALDEK